MDLVRLRSTASTSSRGLTARRHARAKAWVLKGQISRLNHLVKIGIKILRSSSLHLWRVNLVFVQLPDAILGLDLRRVEAGLEQCVFDAMPSWRYIR